MDKKLKIASISIIALLALILGMALFVDTSPKSISTNSKAGQSIANNDDSNNHKAVLAAETPNNQPVYKLFFENSGSMDGYVYGAGRTRLKDVLHDLTTNIESIGLSDGSIQNHYLNTIIIPRNENNRTFINNLSAESFSIAGGNRGRTDMAKIFQLVLNETDDNAISIMVSDCILSPGTGVDATEFFNEHRVQLRRYFTERIRESNLNTLVYRLETDFSGLYYNQFEQRTNIQDSERPYFIWFFGNEKHINALKPVLDNSPLLQRDLRNSHYFVIWSSEAMTYSLLVNPKTGSFTLDRRNPQTVMQNARAESKGNLKGVFEFSVGVDFASFPLGEDYFTNPDNYKLSDGYTIRIEKSNHQNYTHTLRLRTQNLRSGPVEINLKNQIPSWVETYSLNDDTNILSSEQIDKTFGVKYLFKGVHEGYMAHQDYNDYFFQIQIHVHQ